MLFLYAMSPLFLLSLQSFMCPSGTLGCLRAWQFLLPLLASDLCHVCHHTEVWDNCSTERL